MSMRFVVAARASLDLDAIIRYVLENSGPRRAELVADRLCDAFRRLADSPFLGHRRADVTQGPVLFYRVWLASDRKSGKNGETPRL
mgnify:CR=1 FL=1